MNSSLKKYLIIFGSGASCLLLMTWAVFNKYSPHREISPLESSLAQIHLGISKDEANTLMGSPPDATLNANGVVVNSKTMLSAVNELATKYGVPQKYSLHTWKRGDGGATIVFDQTGKAVCRWAYSQYTQSHHPYSPYQVLKRVGLI